MSSNVSPVLAAFLQGQKQQSDVIGNANEILQRREALKQRQQEINDTMKRFNISSQREQEQLDLNTQIHNLTVKQHLHQAGIDLVNHLMANPSVAPDSLHTITPQASPQMQIPGMPGQSGPQLSDVTNKPQAVMAPPQPGEPVTMDVGYGPQTVTMPKSTASQQIEQLQALMPVKKAEAQQVQDIRDKSAESMFEMKSGQQEVLNAVKMAQQKQEFNQTLAQKQAELAQKELLFNIGIGAKADLQTAKAELDSYKTLGGTPEEFAARVKDNAEKVRSGQLDLASINNPMEKTQTRNAMTNLDYVEPKKAVIQKFMSHADDASKFIQTMEQIKPLIQSNGLTNKISAGFQKMLPDALTSDEYQKFKSFNQTIVTGLEKAQGVSLSRGGSSVPFTEMQKNIPPRFTDDPATITAKVNNGLDLHLTAAAQELSGMRSKDKTIFWHRIVDEHPELLSNPMVGPKLVRAARTGIYTPGEK